MKTRLPVANSNKHMPASQVEWVQEGIELLLVLPKRPLKLGAQVPTIPMGNFPVFPVSLIPGQTSDEACFCNQAFINTVAFVPTSMKPLRCDRMHPVYDLALRIIVCAEQDYITTPHF